MSEEIDPSLRTLDAFLKWCGSQDSGKDESVSDLLRNLHQNKIPTGSNFRINSTRAIKLALRSLLFLEVFMRLQSCRTEAADMIQKVWSNHIWPWLKFLQAHCITEKSLGDILMLASLHIIPYTLSSFGWHPILRKSMIRTSGFVAMLAQH